MKPDVDPEPSTTSPVVDAVLAAMGMIMVVLKLKVA